MDSESLNNKEKFEIAIQAGLNAIPYIGGSLSSLYFGAKQERRFKRIEAHYGNIAKEIERFKSIIKPIEDHDENKLASLIEEINEGVENDFTEEKFIYFQNCFYNLLTDPKEESFRKRKYFISILNLLSELDIQIIINLYKTPDGGYKPDYSATDPNNTEFIASLEKLKSFGIVNSSLNGTLRPGVNWSEITLYSILIFGKEFTQFCLENAIDKII